MKRKIKQESLDRYKHHLVETEKSHATIEKYMRDINKLYCFLPASKRMDKQQLLDFKEMLIKEYRASSVNSILAAVNSFLTYMNWKEWHLKYVKVQRPVFCREEQELSVREYKALLKTAREYGSRRLYLIMLTICSTGIRVSELKYITVEAARKGAAQVNSKNKLRTILIPQKVKVLLLQYASEKKIRKGSVFVTREGRQISRTNIWSAMKKISRKAGVPEEKVYPHNLRHLFARTYYQQEKDIVKLADLLGHASIDTTRIYTLASPKQCRYQLNRMDLII